MFLNTEMTLVVFYISLVEIIMLFGIILYHLGRPAEKQRKWFIILLSLLISYNITSGLFPDPNIPISIIVQNILAYIPPVIMSVYFSYYLYKAFDLVYLKFFATYGAILFLLVPLVIMEVLYYLQIVELESFRQLLVIAPTIFILAWLYYLTQSVIKKYKDIPEEEREYLYKERIVSVYLAFIFWGSLPFVTFVGDYQILEHSLTNAGFIVMTVQYLRWNMFYSKTEYKKLMSSVEEVEQLNLELESKAKELTKSAFKMAKNNEVLQKINASIAELEYNDRQKFKPILDVINNDLLTVDTEWESFYQNFDILHQGLFKRLKESSYDLNDNECKMLAFSKLGMDNKEVAKVLGVTTESLKTYRYKLRKKLDLKENEDLTDFINGIIELEDKKDKT